MRRICFATLALAALATAGHAEVPPKASVTSIARSVLNDRLRDYSAARFRAVSLRQYSAEHFLLCGQLNGVNAMGGRSGWVPFVLDLQDGAFLSGVSDPAASAVTTLCSSASPVSAVDYAKVLSP